MAPLLISTPLPSFTWVFSTARCITKQPASICTEGLTIALEWHRQGTSNPASCSFSTQASRIRLLPKAATAWGNFSRQIW